MAKKNNQQDEQVQEMLDKALGRYRELLLKVANSKKDETTFAYEQRFFTAMQKGVEDIKKVAKRAVDNAIPNFRKPMSDILQSYGANYSGEELKLTVYSRVVSTLTQSVAKYRDNIAEIVRKGEEQGEPITVADLQEIIDKDLRENNVAVVEYKNGANMPLEKYVGMVARSTRAETANLVMIQQALREGIDLVECDTVFPTCDICAVYQGRVYSISGKDSRYPALYKTAFKSGYSIIHPNCRHSWTPYHEELYTDKELDEMRKRSNRSWQPDGDGKAFQQTERARAEYARGQQLMRQWNAEILEYEKMKAYYKSIGEEPPYKTLGAFRREVRKPKDKQSVAFRAMRNQIADIDNGENKVKVIPLNQESIKGAKYEAKFAEILPPSIVHTVAVKARQILRENNRKKEETVVCFSIDNGEIVYEQHSIGVKLNLNPSALINQPKDKIILLHNHPSGKSITALDLEYMEQHPQVHTILAVSPNGKVFSLRTNCGKTLDRYRVSEYNRNKDAGLTREEILKNMAKDYNWEYKEL